MGAGSVHHAAIKPFNSTSISSINVEKQSGMKRSNDGQPDVRGGDLRTSVPVVFSPYKLCFSLFANINDCHGQSWLTQHSAHNNSDPWLDSPPPPSKNMCLLCITFSTLFFCSIQLGALKNTLTQDINFSRRTKTQRQQNFFSVIFFPKVKPF